MNTIKRPDWHNRDIPILPPCPGDSYMLEFVKGNERYIFLYDDASRGEALRVLGRFAGNHELSFDWYDAATLAQKIRAG